MPAMRIATCVRIAGARRYAVLLLPRVPPSLGHAFHCLLGNGNTPMVHHPQYVSDDAILPIGSEVGGESGRRSHAISQVVERYGLTT